MLWQCGGYDNEDNTSGHYITRATLDEGSTGKMGRYLPTSARDVTKQHPPGDGVSERDVVRLAIVVGGVVILRAKRVNDTT